MRLIWLYHQDLSVASYSPWESCGFVFVTTVQYTVYENTYVKVYYAHKVVSVCLQSTLSHYQHYAEFPESMEHIKC